jgi:hypothetical protein
MDKELKNYFITERMFCLFLCIDMIMENFSLIFSNPQVKISEQHKELDIILTFVGIFNKNQRDQHIQQNKHVEMNNIYMLLTKL